jgi:hypothetical protein
MTNIYQYTGDGYQFVAGVPARDLTDAEFKSLPEAQQAEALASGLYLAPEPTPKKSVKEANNG